jgi:predicted metal-dependent hydrolase
MAQSLKQSAHHIIIGSLQLPLIATRHLRSKRLILRYDAKKQLVKLTLPRGVSLAQGMAFAQSKTDWLAAQLKQDEAVMFVHGAVLPLWGNDYRLSYIGGRGFVQIEDGVILVSGDEAFFARRVRDFIKQETLKKMSAIAHEHAAKLGVKARKITLRETTSRWGSCSAKGEISLCWRLAFAPYAVMHYVVCHEVAHLLHHNHSKAFWDALEHICPQFAPHEKWLTKHGSSLWLYN